VVEGGLPGAELNTPGLHPEIKHNFHTILTQNVLKMYIII